MKKTKNISAVSGKEKKHKLPGKPAAIIVAAVALMASGYLLSWIIPIHPPARRIQDPAGAVQPVKFKLVRNEGTSLVRPLLYVAGGQESQRYAALKEKLNAIVRQWQQKQDTKDVSVYLRNLADATWMGIDEGRTYLPGSMMKVPIMIAILKQEQEHPGTLNRTLHYDKLARNFPSQEFKGDSILAGRDYRISELLRYMVVESDNYSTYLLSRELDPAVFRKLFFDLEIPPDEINDINYVISARDYSRFFRVLYNGTYLPPDLSEFALSLLSKSRFSDGIAKTLPAGVIAPRKFGERGINEVTDFSESAIVYKGDEPYSLTIMTKGSSAERQAELISELASAVYAAFPCK